MIPVVDQTGLSQKNKTELGRHVVFDCYSTPIERRWLKAIVVRNDGGTDYTGYWTADVTVDADGIVRDIEAFIILNRSYLPTLEEMKETLSHEYGHHVTLSYMLMSFNVADDLQQLLKTRAPVDYYRARNIEDTYAQAAPFYELGWCNCDKELLAEDYRVLFTTSTRPHRMAELSPENTVARGAPPAIARDWIWRLFQPQAVGEKAWPFPT
ncbi:MAG: hypothetical protein HY744_04905 [Deltaproteobacteria bacterium]|nr:hypothetical protein [Deltaproteobacteria bacterium]